MPVSSPRPTDKPVGVAVAAALAGLGLTVVFASRVVELGKQALLMVALRRAGEWLPKLPDAERKQFLDELRAIVNEGRIGELDRLLRDWQATAEALDSEDLMREFAEPVIEPGPVIRPASVPRVRKGRPRRSAKEMALRR